MQTLNLFSEIEDEIGVETAFRTSPSILAQLIDDVAMAEQAMDVLPGLEYFPEFISRDEEWDLLQHVDASPWSSQWQRRTQFYGRRYTPAEDGESAGARVRMNGSYSGGHLPWWCMGLRQRLVDQDIFDRLPNQMGINEYLPGQGIAAHVDYNHGTVVSITLGTGCLMDFTEIDGPGETSTWLAPRSIVVLKGAARNRWRHGIARRKSDIVAGTPIARGRRVSVTFRYIA